MGRVAYTDVMSGSHAKSNLKTLDLGTLEALLQRFRDYRLPRAERLLERVSAGEKLTDYDIAWLKRVHADGKMVQGLLQRHPEYDELMSRGMQLFTQIIEKGVANEGGARKDPATTRD